MTKFSNKFKNPIFDPFWAHFPNFQGKKFFLENPALSHTTPYGFLAQCKNLEKVNDTIQRKHPQRWKDGWKNRETLFYKTLPASAGGPIKANKYLHAYKKVLF